MPGRLRLYGRDSPASRFDQSLVGRRIRHLSFEAETELELDPASHMQFAGLMLRYDESSFYYLNVARDDESGELVLAYMETLAGAFSYVGRVAVLGEGSARMKATSRGGELSFAYSQGSAPFAECGLAKDLRLLADGTAYPIGFTGAFVCICASDLLGRRTPADFSCFDYRALE